MKQRIDGFANKFFCADFSYVFQNKQIQEIFSKILHKTANWGWMNGANYFDSVLRKLAIH